jgi:hypothetical protein
MTQSLKILLHLSLKGLSMKIIIISFCLIALTSCSVGENMLKIKPAYDKIIKANEISFFGVFKHMVNAEKTNFTFLYEKDSLKYIAVGDNKNIYKNKLYKIDFFSDSLNMISLDSYGRYRIVDSLLFTKNECIVKRTYYSIEGYLVSSIKPLMINYRCYYFTDKMLIRFAENPHWDNNNVENIALKEFHDNKKIIDVSKLSSYSETKYENIEDAKMLFFKSHIAR